MKYLKGMPIAALAAALVLAVGLAGTIGTANAGTITHMTIWNQDTNGVASAKPALPTNTIRSLANLLVDGAVLGAPEINFNIAAGPDTTVSAFLASNASFTASNPGFCPLCASAILSNSGFDTSTLFRITFTAPTDEIFSVLHDDGVSLFAAGDESSNLLPATAADPTTPVTHSRSLLAGNYDLWYLAANGNPEVLQVTETPVPEPATMFLGGLGLIAFGYAARRRLFGR